jgi:hypothetical protein
MLSRHALRATRPRVNAGIDAETLFACAAIVPTHW